MNDNPQNPPNSPNDPTRRDPKPHPRDSPQPPTVTGNPAESSSPPPPEPVSLTGWGANAYEFDESAPMTQWPKTAAAPATPQDLSTHDQTQLPDTPAIPWDLTAATLDPLSGITEELPADRKFPPLRNPAPAPAHAPQRPASPQRPYSLSALSGEDDEGNDEEYAASYFPLDPADTPPQLSDHTDMPSQAFPPPSATGPGTGPGALHNSEWNTEGTQNFGATPDLLVNRSPTPTENSRCESLFDFQDLHTGPKDAATFQDPILLSDKTPGFGTGEGGPNDAGAGRFEKPRPIPQTQLDPEGLVPGQILFHKYEILKKIGAGGMGTVWLVNHHDLNAHRALKMIISDISSNSEAHKRFQREARAMAAFSTHPHAVVVHDAKLARDNLAYIEMEFIQGQSLSSFLKPGVALPLDLTARIMEQLCDVLDVAHKNQIVHRDLKPSNIMILDDRPPGREHIKVLDFGIAKMLGEYEPGGALQSESLKTGGFLGTAAYASPEQCAFSDESGPEGGIDTRSDIYSSGIILYELLTGYRPFTGHPIKVLHDHINTSPPPLHVKNPQSPAGEALGAFVLHCLAKKPADRPQTARRFAEEFFQALRTDNPNFAVKPSTNLGGTLEFEVGPLIDRPFDGSSASYNAFKTEPDTSAKRAAMAVIGLGALVIALTAGVIILLIQVSGDSKSNPDDNPKLSAEPKPTAAKPIPVLPETYRIVTDDPKGPEQGAWPLVIARADNAAIRYQRVGDGRYIPEGYTPLPNAPDAPDGWPSAILAADGSRYLRIPANEFLQGAAPQPNAPDLKDGPPHSVKISGFYIGEHEITNRALGAFLNGNAFLPPADDSERALWNAAKTEWQTEFDTLAIETFPNNKPEAERHPAAFVPYALARAYAQSQGGDLPTESQWEAAARSGGKPMRYVWGNDEPTAQFAKIDIPAGPTAPGGTFPKDKTAQGVYDLMGNVREWCRDVWKPYVGAKTAAIDPFHAPASDPVSASQESYVVRGGSFMSNLDEIAVSARQKPEPRIIADKNGPPRFFNAPDLGFRIVLECPPLFSSQSADNDSPPLTSGRNYPPPPPLPLAPNGERARNAVKSLIETKPLRSSIHPGKADAPKKNP